MISWHQNGQAKFGYCDTEGIPIVYQSECMDLRPNETKSVWLVEFNVTEQADVVLETSGRYAYNTTITGTQVEYEVFNNERICTPSSSNGTCVITSCNYSFPYYMRRVLMPSLWRWCMVIVSVTWSNPPIIMMLVLILVQLRNYRHQLFICCDVHSSFFLQSRSFIHMYIVLLLQVSEWEQQWSW